MITIYTFTTRVRDVSETDNSFFSVKGLDVVFHVGEHAFKEGDIVKFTIEKIEKDGPGDKVGGTISTGPLSTHPEEEIRGGELTIS